jgi:predicted O-methyltransferase YrrM
MYGNITTFLNSKGIHEFEGYSQQIPEQVSDLIRLSERPNMTVMEIGFNAGHSAEIFLKNNPSLTLTSFDLGIHNYVKIAKEYIDSKYPNRHTLIIGDSTQTIPQFIENNKDAKFDFIFIDGGHSYEIAKSDLENCFYLAHKDTVVALDDTIFTRGWERDYTIGPTNTWKEHLRQRKIYEHNRKEYCHGRGMVWGKYVL